MTWTYYPLGKDEVTEPCFEFDDGSLHEVGEVGVALVKALVEKGTITLQDIIDEL